MSGADSYRFAALVGQFRHTPSGNLARCRAAAHIFILTLLAGCDHLPRTVSVPVPVACVKPEQIPERPPLTLDDKRAPRGARTSALLLYQTEAAPYIESLEAIAQNCARIK